ncbi:YedE-related selenium metabolism membrane protein [Pseudoflavonifractor sp. AF19-9AC]|uniref:YedE family putative selenium transporter n=1 Tax=Pseudoflavonifractor sp. AF19-9AC TaxID=2292244 RepID=UPI000E531403|nr:YedE family putative selenium transporter [Pseudoflavonifractor sp. AF19-9AC]RHR08953.1 YedE-related selenium metabolism membrane protein [Pseudoflavonifractor sp. AF19-9AC]
MPKTHEKTGIVLAGIAIGVIASLLVFFGNPVNMGFCIACFLRDISGALGLHTAPAVQYIRPEILGLVLGSFLLSVFRKEFMPRGGSSPLTRFVLGFFVMIGCLMFLGCPFRMILRLAGGDLNAVFGLLGFVCGILAGVFFLNKGYSLKRTYKLPTLEGAAFSAIQVALLVLLVAAPAFIYFSEAGAGPGALHAPILISLAAGLIVGALAQRTRLCMVGGIRDLVLFGEWKLLAGFIAILASALVCNLVLTGTGAGTFFTLGMEGQPVAHTDGLWNFLGMLLAGFGCVLLGGCPLRQLVLSGEGNTDSAITVLGLGIGAAFAHNFGLASSGTGPTANGKVAVVIGIVVVAVIAVANTVRTEKA